MGRNSKKQSKSTPILSLNYSINSLEQRCLKIAPELNWWIIKSLPKCWGGGRKKKAIKNETMTKNSITPIKSFHCGRRSTENHFKQRNKRKCCDNVQQQQQQQQQIKWRSENSWLQSILSRLRSNWSNRDGSSFLRMAGTRQGNKNKTKTYVG